MNETNCHSTSSPSSLSSQSSFATVNLFGIPVAKVTEEEAVARIIAFAKARNSQLTTHNSQLSTKLVATLNVDFVANAVSGWPFGGNDELWGYLKTADLVTADGMPIVLLSKLMRNPLPERVTGADMVPAIFHRCAEEGLSVYVLGGDKETVEAAFEKLGALNGQDARCPSGVLATDEDVRSPSERSRETRDSTSTTTNPQLSTINYQLSTINSQPRIAGIDPAFIKLDQDQPEIVDRINAAKPDVLFVALGNPKQELWMGRNRAKLEVGVMIGVGGTFNFIAGKVKRAPKWMQRCGLEWIYRILQEPRRLWRRYAYGLFKFSWLSFRALLGGFR